MWGKLRVWLAMLALLALSVSGFWGVDQEWRYAVSFGEKFSTLMQTAYSVLGLVAILVLLLRRRWARGLLYLWSLTLILTGATAPIIWGGGGWWQGLFAAGLTALCAGLVIWLAPLPPAEGALRWGRWLVVAFVVAAALVVLTLTAQYAPLAVHARSMESFCEGTRDDLTEAELTALVQQQGYTATPGKDDKGAYLRIEDEASHGEYRCEARFKPDGHIQQMNFTAGVKN